MTLQNGYTMTTTFYYDFSIADLFGEHAIRDTYKRAFSEWKDNYIYLTELVISLNLKIFEWYKKNKDISMVYDELWREADEYACNNLTGDKLSFFYDITD